MFLPFARTVKLTVNRSFILSTKLPINGIIINKYRNMSSNVKLLTQKEAIEVDEELFNEYKYSVDQLMELAGLSCAIAIAKSYDSKEFNKVLIICGPGNNGGDGLVAARHLSMMGFSVEIHYPKRTSKPLFQNLTHQCVKYGINFIEQCPTAEEMDSKYKIVVDALFGFSFKPPVRSEMMPLMMALANTKSKLCSVDIPSGWDVNSGPPNSGPVLSPDMLISLSAPKNCAKYFTGKWHYLGGRFIPPAMIEKYSLQLPEYPGTEQVVLIKHNNN